jgi:hypothetical protein
MKIILISILSLFSLCSFAQDSTKKWQVSAELAFSSFPTVSVSGTDTIYKSVLSVSPGLTIRNKKNGLGIYYSPSIVLGGSQPGIFLHTLAAGIEQYDKKRFDIVADYIHYFFTSNESSPVSLLNNEVYFYLCYKKPWLQPSFSADFAFNVTTGKKSSFLYDAALSAGAGHMFEWEQNNFTFNVKPSLKLNAATDNYYSFMRGTKYITHGNSYKKYLKKSSSFNLSVNNVELGIESSLEKGAFTVRPAFSLYLPVSSGTSGIDGYWQLTFEYKF